VFFDFVNDILASKPKPRFADSQPGSSEAPLLLEYQGALPGGFQSGEDDLPGAAQSRCSSTLGWGEYSPGE
jgi:hypothetical protein